MAASKGMDELATELQSYRGQVDAFGAVTLFAESDHLRAYAALFDTDRAPVSGHLVLARAVVEASVVSAWLNDASIGVEERVRRGVVERIHSARQQQRIKDFRPKGKQEENDMKTVAQVFGWPLHLGDSTTDIEVPGTRRPAPGPEATKVLVDIAGSTLGQTLLSYQSGIMHSPGTRSLKRSFPLRRISPARSRRPELAPVPTLGASTRRPSALSGSSCRLEVGAHCRPPG
jgi:hypothetical protein